MDINNNDPNRIVSKLTDMMNISRAEYETLLRDKSQLDIILNTYINKEYSFNTDKLVEVVCKMRGLMA